MQRFPNAVVNKEKNIIYWDHLPGGQGGHFPLKAVNKRNPLRNLAIFQFANTPSNFIPLKKNKRITLFLQLRCGKRYS